MFVVSFLCFNDPKMKSFPTDVETLEFLKENKEETVIEHIFKVGYDGVITFYEPDFVEGKFALIEIEVV